MGDLGSSSVSPRSTPEGSVAQTLHVFTEGRSLGSITLASKCLAPSLKLLIIPLPSHPPSLPLPFLSPPFPPALLPLHSSTSSKPPQSRTGPECGCQMTSAAPGARALGNLSPIGLRQRGHSQGGLYLRGGRASLDYGLSLGGYGRRVSEGEIHLKQQAKVFQL